VKIIINISSLIILYNAALIYHSKFQMLCLPAQLSAAVYTVQRYLTLSDK